MLNAVWWLFMAEAIGLAAFPLAYHLLPSLRDRGYSVSKAFGLLLIGYATWILSQLKLVPSTQASIAALLLILAALSTWYVWRKRAEMAAFLRREWLVIAAVEAVFLVFFIGWTLYRAYDPAIDHTEQPMDFAFLNASIQTTTGSPTDPWLSGESVSYYYFGYWIMGALSELTAIPSNISYNLALALIPAMAAQAVFGLVYTMTSSRTSRQGPAIAGSVGAVLLFGVAANLEGAIEFMRANAMGTQGFWDWLRVDGLNGPLEQPVESWRPEEFWWWFRATRVINTFDGSVGLDYTIQEFPYFSYILGDLHPHVMAIPFALLALAFCWDLFRRDVSLWSWHHRTPYVYLLALALVLGGLAFTNMWDFPTYASLMLGVAALKSYSLATRGKVTRLTRATLWIFIPPLLAVAAIAMAFILFLPYYLSFKSSVSGIEPVQAATTRPVHLAIVWGLSLVVVGPFIITTFWRTTLKSDWARTSTLALAIVATPVIIWAFLHLESGGATSDISGRIFQVLPLGALITVGAYTALWSVREEGATGKSFALAVATLGLMLIMGPELIFIDDSFGTRMNTVFKLYYQAWLLMALAGGFAVYYWGDLRAWVKGWRRSLTTLWAGIVVALLIGALYYAPAAAYSKAGAFSANGTLDGLDYLARARPAERDAIEFVRQEVKGESVIVEAVGEWFESGLISRSTGVPTVLNWPGHEIQWRGSADAFDGREQDVATIYQTLDEEEAVNLLANYDVDYVYVGPRERSKYGVEGLQKFGGFMDVVLTRDDVVIYRVR